MGLVSDREVVQSPWHFETEIKPNATVGLLGGAHGVISAETIRFT
jgi:hypothetical protein